jgi:Zinc knuckle
VRARLPDTYNGKDDFDQLDNWLQGLLCNFKLNHLTGMHRDADHILVTGTCLTGKAERWFSHEVKHPTHIIHDWTFEMVIIELYHAFITTAMAQQAMQWYMQVRYLREEGVVGFYHDLMLWAGRLAQFPDPYSFKRRLLNGLPAEYRHHLTLFDGITPEHSSITDIVLRAQCLEKTLTSMRSGCVQNPTTVTPATDTLQRPTTSRTRPCEQCNQCPRFAPTRQPPSQCRTEAQNPPLPWSAAAEQGKTSVPLSARKGDTSNLTCYKCGKVGHIASDPKCSQYKKPEQRQIFAAQVMDDTDLTDQPDHLNAPDGPDKDLEREVEEDTVDDSQNKLPVEEEYPDGSQYEDEESPDHYDYDKYQGPSEEDGPVYIRAMHEDEHSVKSVPPQFDNIDWESCRDSIKTCYQCAPWMPCNIWEFTLCNGITHICGCEICTRYKEHCVEAEILGDEQESCAWKNCNNYEQDLIHLRWTLAHEGGTAIPPPKANLMTLSAFNNALQCRSHWLTTQLEAVC